MSMPNYTIVPQLPDRQPEIEIMLDQVFGLSRQTKASYRLREGEWPVAGLSYVAQTDGGELLGAISFWAIHIGRPGIDALLLGPLAVAPSHRGQGVGLELMRHGLADAKRLGHQLVILVGDEPYYSRAGFHKVPPGQLLMPGPVDPRRLLYLELEDGALTRARGLVLSPRRYALGRGRTGAQIVDESNISALRDTTSG